MKRFYIKVSNVSQCVLVLKANSFPELHNALMRAISLSPHRKFAESPARDSTISKHEATFSGSPRISKSHEQGTKCSSLFRISSFRKL
jgi:hypothetical protein